MQTAAEAAETYAVLARAFEYPSAAVGTGHLESEYLATFEHGRVPLYEGLCRSADERFWVQEELLRFYHHFGVRLSSSDRDYPDHFATELQFMRHLTELAAAAPTEEARRSLQRAQRDFLARHLSAWSERLPALIEERAGAKAYLQLAQCAQSAVRDHIDHLNRVLGDA
jgi:DMSO reductase family type II enzyme chaperone